MRISDWSSDVCSSDLRRTRQAVQMTERPQPESARSVARAPSFASSLPFPGLWRYRRTETTRSSDVDRLEIGRLPTPGARAVAARRNPLPVDRGDDLAVAGKQRFGRAHHGDRKST